MPPRLRHGQPVDQNFHAPPSNLRLCTCTACILLPPSIDPANIIKPVQGQYVGSHEYKKHQRRDKDRKTARAVLESLAVPHVELPRSTPTFFAPFLPKDPISTQSQQSLPRTPPIAPYSPVNTLPEDFLLKKLREIEAQTRVQSIRIAVPDPTKLVFSEPPSSRSAPLADSSVLPTLNPHSLSNARFVDYAAWVRSCVTACDEVDHRKVKSTNLKLIKKLLAAHFESENQDIDGTIRSEWERQRQVAIHAARFKVSVDTSEYFSGFKGIT
ncbi:hypothetical protein FPV67DRAFT_1676134 [Lyophyllum atratum]|nr:hypothetical protein FPV67DRAFT_1676134 [Lyophyllum atratum]